MSYALVATSIVFVIIELWKERGIKVPDNFRS